MTLSPRRAPIAFAVMVLILLPQLHTYEKTLRKIVRNQSKMVQTPFSASLANHNWKNATIHTNEDLMFSELKTVIHKIQRPKVSTILSSMEPAGRGKSAYTKLVTSGTRKENMFPNELRLARNSPPPVTSTSQTIDVVYAPLAPDKKNHTPDFAHSVYYEIPTQSKFFPPVEEPATESKSDIVTPPDRGVENDTVSLMQGLYVAPPRTPPTGQPPPSTGLALTPDLDGDRVDYLIQATQEPATEYRYNASRDAFTCTILHISQADIDAQIKFNELDIEPPWMSNKQYWDHVFESRYESLMRTPEWPSLKVILVPRTKVESVWKRPFERLHDDTVHQIISNLIKKMHFYANLTFAWNEVSHLSHWWKTANAKNRSAFRRLVKSGRLEVTTGGWVEPDEATIDLFGLVHQLIQGHQWLKTNLNHVPSVAWTTNTVAHSPTMAYVLSACGVDKLVLSNVHYAWEEYLAEYQLADFVWLQSWRSDGAGARLNRALKRLGRDRYPRHALLTHALQFNEDGFAACGPDRLLCLAQFNFKAGRNIDVYDYNVKDKAELLLEQYSKTGTLSSHNVVLAPLGQHYHYEHSADFDYQYNNYLKLAEYLNSNHDIYRASIQFGTPRDYFGAVAQRYPKLPTLRGDFLNFADITTGSPAYWVGYFTTRPLFKIMLRRLLWTLRTTEILFSFAVNYEAFQDVDVSNLIDLLADAREVAARLQDRNVVGGTLTANGLKYAHQLILTTVKNCWYIQEVTASLMSIKPGKRSKAPYLIRFVYRQGEIMSAFRTVGPGDQVYLFNSLSHERTEVVELIVRNPHIRIIDHNKKDVRIQINPMWRYTSDNYIRISRRYFKIVFATVIPPLTLELYKIRETFDASLRAATVYCGACAADELAADATDTLPFSVQPLQPGDIQLESYKLRLVFDELTGLLKHVVDKFTNVQRKVVMDYGAFRSSDKNAGTFLFNTNVTKPLRDVLLPFRIGAKSKLVIIISGQVTTEVTSIFGRLLQNTVRIYNTLHSPLSNAIYVESKVDFEASPKNRDLELFLSIQTDVSNGNPPQLFTDDNGFQYTRRLLNVSRRVESNVYPMTTMAFIQDSTKRVTLLTDHAQGVTALQEGQILVILDRRVLFNDGRGAGEGLADSSATCHRHIILLENLVSVHPDPKELQLPSMAAVHLSHALDYPLDIFVIDKNQTYLLHYAFLPLVKTSLPCDVSLLTFRLALKGPGAGTRRLPSSALMVLHRQSISCNFALDLQIHCSGEGSFQLDKILHKVQAVYQTNLAGTDKGVPIANLNHEYFPPMELTSLRVYF